MEPRVLVGCPTSEHKLYCLQDYADAVKRIQYPRKDILLVDNSKEDTYFQEIYTLGLPVIKGPYFEKAKDRIIASRNILREHVLKEGYDYFLSLEQDVIPEPNVIQTLLSHQKEIVGGVVYNNLPLGSLIKRMPMVYVPHPKDPTGLEYISEEKLKKPQIIEVKACALACMLIHRDVLEKIQFRYMGGFDDMMFCKDAIAQGYTLFVDTAVQPIHKHSSWEGILQ